jgi:rhodanese-related sulfurtransferase
MEQLAQFAGNHVLMMLGLIAAFGLVAAYELRLRAHGVTHVSPGDAVRLINKSALVVDVRSAEAFKSGHIVNSRNVPLANLSSDPDTLKKQKAKVVLAVCDTGMDAGKAAGLLRKAGFEKTFSLRGGLRAWQAENLPLAK